MANYFISYDSTVNTKNNDKVFLDMYSDDLMKLHKLQGQEERINAHSVKQYDILLYQLALSYSIRLFFIILSAVKDNTISEVEAIYKDKYKFNEIQINLAHKGIDLDKIYDQIVINYTPVAYEQ